jgi:hypothetical protein
VSTYPFIPKHGTELSPGDWWEIVTDRVFGFGVCAGSWHKTGVLAAFLTCTKSEPILTAEDPLEIFAMGYLDLRGIAYCGGQVRGNIPFDLEALLDGARVTHRDLKFNEPRMIIRKAMAAAKKQGRQKR